MTLNKPTKITVRTRLGWTPNAPDQSISFGLSIAIYIALMLFWVSRIA
jgi:hypothetical protein